MLIAVIAISFALVISLILNLKQYDSIDDWAYKHREKVKETETLSKYVKLKEREILELGQKLETHEAITNRVFEPIDHPATLEELDFYMCLATETGLTDEQRRNKVKQWDISKKTDQS